MPTDPQFLLDPVSGTNLERIDASEAAELTDRRTLVRDDRRTRPLYFDGRFLTAADLTRDQSYFLARQADLGRAIGTGVGEGLEVRRVAGSRTRIQIGAGYGVTPTGELVTLLEPLEVDVADVAQIQRLDANFGLTVLPAEPATSMDGVFAISLRLVEYTDTPIGGYPTSITGDRVVSDSEIVEAVAVSLVPYRVPGTKSRRRSAIANQVFVEGREPGLPVSALPIALVQLSGGLVDWVDMHLVRREIGAGRSGVFGFGLTGRAQREAFLLQYQSHLANVMSDLGLGSLRTASDQFVSLPPIGQLPKDTVDAVRLTQRFFPPEMSVSIAVVPKDELAVLVQERLMLPAIDLTASAEELSSVGVDILIPVERANLKETLDQLSGPLAALRGRTPNKQTRTNLFSTMASRRRTISFESTSVLTNVSPWQALLAAADDRLWYARRRSFNVALDELAEALLLPADFEPEPINMDTDGGGVTDLVEVERGTDPTDPSDDFPDPRPPDDSDGGGVTDVVELERGTDPTDPSDDFPDPRPPDDSDGGGVTDVVEAERGTDPNDPSDDFPVDRPPDDSDGGGVTDVIEAERGTDPNDPTDDFPAERPPDDRDGGGVTDAVEIARGTDPDDASDDFPADRPPDDTDGGGVTDETEIARGTDPNNPDDDFPPDRPPDDSDGGGVTDETEIARGTNPNDPADDFPPTDSDGGGVTDDVEIRRGSDPNNPSDDFPPDRPPDDSDGGGVTDETEILRGTDPNNPSDDFPADRPPDDSDGGGVTDETEIRRGTDPNNPDDDFPADRPPDDSDGGGVTDDIERQRGTNPDDPSDDFPDPRPPDDSDGGGVTDDVERQLGTDPTNPQDDFPPDRPPDDTDGGGVTDTVEAARGTNPRDPDDDFFTTSGGDSDGGGVTDIAELERGTDPNNPRDDFAPDLADRDSDGGGIPDRVEVARGSDPNNPDDDRIPFDTDQGGVDDLTEIQRGTDPLDPRDDTGDVIIIPPGGGTTTTTTGGTRLSVSGGRRVVEELQAVANSPRVSSNALMLRSFAEEVRDADEVDADLVASLKRIYDRAEAGRGIESARSAISGLDGLMDALVASGSLGRADVLLQSGSRTMVRDTRVALRRFVSTGDVTVVTEEINALFERLP